MLVLTVAATIAGGFGVIAQIYPKEPLLDVDYIHDSNNPLDSFHWDKKAPTSTLPPATLPPTTPRSPPSQDAAEAAVAEAEAAAAAVAEEVGAKGKVSTLATCVTNKDRHASWFSETAAEGTQCVFGVDSRDEGNHCIFDAQQRYGEFGWCWTNKDKSEWGSCSEGCPLFGPAKKLMLKVDRFASVVSRWRDLIAQQKQLQQEAAAASISLPTSLPDDGGPLTAEQASKIASEQVTLAATPQQVALEFQAPVGPVGKTGATRNLLDQHVVAQPVRGAREITESMYTASPPPTALLGSEKKHSTMSLKELLRLAAKEATRYSDIALFQVSTIAKRPSMNHYCAWEREGKDATRDARCA